MKEIDSLLQQLAAQKTPNLPNLFEANVWREINRQSQPTQWKAWLWPWQLTPSLVALALFLASVTCLLTHLEFNENKAAMALDLTSFSSYPQNLPSTLLLEWEK